MQKYNVQTFVCVYVNQKMTFICACMYVQKRVCECFFSHTNRCLCQKNFYRYNPLDVGGGVRQRHVCAACPTNSFSNVVSYMYAGLLQCVAFCRHVCAVCPTNSSSNVVSYMYGSVLRCVAVCCIVLRCVAVCYNALQFVVV